MDILSGQILSDIIRVGLIGVVLFALRPFFRGVLGFFVLSEEDRLAAGVDLGGDGREE
jgi:hypothetical protein